MVWRASSSWKSIGVEHMPIFPVLLAPTPTSSGPFNLDAFTALHKKHAHGRGTTWQQCTMVDVLHLWLMGGGGGEKYMSTPGVRMLRD